MRKVQPKNKVPLQMQPPHQILDAVKKGLDDKWKQNDSEVSNFSSYENTIGQLSLLPIHSLIQILDFINNMDNNNFNILNKFIYSVSLESK